MKTARRYLDTCLVAASFVALAPAAYAWTPGENYDVVIKCKELPRLAADKLVVRITITDGSFGLPVLLGIKDEKEIWRRPFLEADEINVAKYTASCKGSKIILSFQFPAQLPYVVQEYGWNGKNLSRLKEWIKR